MTQRRSFSAALKAKVAIEAIRGQKTLSEIASQYEVHPNRVWLWRKLALEKLAEVMADAGGGVLCQPTGGFATLREPQGSAPRPRLD